MALNFLVLVFVLGLTFLHSLFGFFSGLVNVFCSLTALAVAFGFYEPLNDLLTKQLALHSGYTEPAALVLLFALTLGGLRFAADNLVRGNVRVPRWVDFAGGGVCGFVNAQIAMGVLVLGFLMLPWGDSALTFKRSARDPDSTGSATQRVKFERHGLWLGTDEFVIHLVDLLSRGSLTRNTAEQRRDFATVYPDFAEWIFWSGNNVQEELLTSPYRDKKGDGFLNGLTVENWWEQKAGTTLSEEYTRYRPKKPTAAEQRPPYERFAYKVPAGRKLIGVRIQLQPASAERQGKAGIPYHRFRPTMFRLVGDVGDEPAHFPAEIIGGADSNLKDELRVADFDNNFCIASGSAQIDAYFQVPENFKPRFLEYRRHARTVLPQAKLAKAAPTARLSAATDAGGAPEAEMTGAARMMESLKPEFTGEIARVPLPFDPQKIAAEATLEGNKFASGKVTGDQSAVIFEGAGGEVTEFVIPENMRLLQVQFKARRAKSLLGKVMVFAGAVANQYRAEDNTGHPHELAGYYGIIKRGEQTYIELYYYPNEDDRMQATPRFDGGLRWEFSGMNAALGEQEDAVFGLLFLLPPGTSITKIRSQGGEVTPPSPWNVGS